MATRKTSSTKTTRSTRAASGRKKVVRRKTAEKPSEPDTVTPAVESAEVAPTVESVQQEVPAQTGTKRRRSAARRTSKTEAAPVETAQMVAAEAEARPPAVRRVVEPLSPAAKVEETGEAIVIRFPPVAAPPFAPVAPAARAAGQSPAPAPAAETEAPPAEIIAQARGRVAAAELPPPTTRPPVAATAEATQPREGVRLSRSQRRRLRRKRRQQRLAAGAVSPKAGGGSTAAMAGRPARAGDKPTLTRAEEAIEPGLEATGLVGSEDEARIAWLEDVESAKAEVEKSEREEGDLAVAELPAEGVPERESYPAVVPAAAGTDGAVAEVARGREKGRGRRRGRRAPRPEGAEPVAAALAEQPEEVQTVPATLVTRQPREMIINTVQREECRIAVLEGGRLEEIYIERAAAENHVGNIYKGVVTNVEPSIQAAFIDFGQGKNGFLHISDLHPQYFPNGSGQTENVGRKMPRRNRPPIQRCLRRGQEVLVQVTKEGIGTKGPTLSSYLSIPGRFLVMMPGMRRLGVSRRIEDEAAREKLRNLLAELDLPEGMGFIARTAAVDRTKRELQNDLSYLMRLWKAVEKRVASEPAPAELYRESDLVIRTIRDVFTSDISRIVVDDPEVMVRAREFLSIFSPRSQDIVTLYTDPEPIFYKYGIEAELQRLHSRHVPLKSGGSLVIDQTEALVAIDVNSGRFRSEEDAETTAFKINCEAADEIPRQLRLRDLGGVIVCDFIDMRQEAHRREIERRLIENLKRHKERAKVLRTSAFGLIEITRQRQRASLTRSVYRDCHHCRGTGLVKTAESVTLDVIRLLQLAVTREHIRMVEVTVSPEVAHLLQNRKRALIHELETRHRRVISIRPDPNFGLDQVEVVCTDARGRVVPYT